ncbi:questin oxidase family protein [Kiloniella antarctica]|uniref:Questin oxidase family protein n=1 Tax=Kiloniella antarctica TaxID=1550907 RepID=A0ABW5BKV6_9PROT
MVLGKEIPRIDELAKGISAGVFHALIRMGYGFDAQDVSEVSAGLACLASSYLEVTSNKGKTFRVSSQTVADFIKGLLARRLAGELDALPSEGVIFERMDITAQEKMRQKVISEAYRVCDLSLEKVTEMNLDVFLRANNFTALHAVTASHAARLVLPYVSDHEGFVR